MAAVICSSPVPTVYVPLPYMLPLANEIEALDLAFVKYRLVTSDTLEVVNIPEDVIAEAN